MPLKGGSDGIYPRKGLLLDEEGNLYGTTSEGGDSDLGTVFELMPDGTKITLHSFAGGSDGSSPSSGLVADAEGNLYGATITGGLGGHCIDSCGTVYKITPDGQESVLYAFRGHGGDGATPAGGLVADSQGNLYGATNRGGTRGGLCRSDGCGTIFRVTLDGREAALYAFLGGSDGSGPNGDLIKDERGNFYGTTIAGGGHHNHPGGTVFKVTRQGAHTVLYSFRDEPDGHTPAAGLVADPQGNLYGTTTSGGADGKGTVFKVTPGGHETILHAFEGESDDGWDSCAGLIVDSQGNLYDTTILGGVSNDGVVFKVQN